MQIDFLKTPSLTKKETLITKKQSFPSTKDQPKLGKGTNKLRNIFFQFIINNLMFALSKIIEGKLVTFFNVNKSFKPIKVNQVLSKELS